MGTGLGGSIPQFNGGTMASVINNLYYSNRENALLKDKTFKPGYGVVKAGTLMAAVTADNELVPYTPDTVSTADQGRAFLLRDVSAATTLYVALEDSYRFAVGDTVVVGTSVPAYTDGGLITAIDRTTYPTQATITVTNAITATVANSAHLKIKAGSSGKFCTAYCVCDSDVFTGVGESAAGAVAPVILSNAIVYKNSVNNYDSTAASAMSLVVDGAHIVIK